MLKIFILCAGNGERWNQYLDIPKQLITFGGETLIERTARLVTEQKVANIYCVTRNSQIFLPTNNNLFLSSTDSLAETILATSEFWSTTNVFLLGDVFYSEYAISLILECQKSLMFLGRPWANAFVRCGHGEMFGLSFNIEYADIMRNLLSRGINHNSVDVSANLWNLYQLAGNLPFGSSKHLPELMTTIDDYTNDIDTPIDYFRRSWLYEKISTEGNDGIFMSLRNIMFLPKHNISKLRWRISTL